MRKKLLLGISIVSIFCIFAVSFALAEGIETGRTYNLKDYEAISGEKITDFNESPLLTEKVKSGEIPAVEERLPDNPLVLVPWMEIGQYGGTVSWDEFTTDYDHYLRHINSADLLDRPASPDFYLKAGPIGPTSPGIISEWDRGTEGKIFTFKLREGLKWSDGVPVTTEDVRFYIEEIATNEEINPVAVEWLRWQGETTQLEVVDDLTFKIIFGEPYGAFIEDVVRRVDGGSDWSTFLRPKHYLKQYHKNYADWDKILPAMEDLGYEDESEWGTFYGTVALPSTGGGMIKFPYPEECPTLDPYMVTEVKDSGDWLFERNPYYYMVDTAGNQLPYIDKLHRQYISNVEMVNMDIIQGKTDFQGQFTKLSDYPLFKKNEDKGGYKVMPLKRWQNTAMMFFFNLAVDNEVFPTDLVQEARFRQALSLALDREQIKESIFLGFGRPAQIAPAPGTPHYEEGMDTAYANYDPERAKALLDEIGLVDENGDGWREWNGEQLVIPFVYYEVTPVATPGAEVAKRYWEDIGIKVNINQVNGNYYWQRSNANQIAISVWWGGGAQLPSQHWLKFGPVNSPEYNRWFSTNGESGIEPPDWIKEIRKNSDQILKTASMDERIELGKKILREQAERVWLIGTVAETPVPFIYNKKLGNIEVALERNYCYTTPLEYMMQWYFKE